jgi:hypothetical protein
MDGPKDSDWRQVMDIPLKTTDWTQKCNGVVFDGQYWVFTSNGSAIPLLGEIEESVKDPIAGTVGDLLDVPVGFVPRALYVFPNSTNLNKAHFKDSNKKSWFVFRNKHISNPVGLDHIGQVSFYEGLFYVSHFNNLGTQVIVLRNNHGVMEYIKCIELEKPTSSDGKRTDRAEFQAINPWDGLMYSSYGSGTITELFTHELEGVNAGKLNKKRLTLRKPIVGNNDTKEYPVQGACFSPNGHLYIASNVKAEGDRKFQTIYCYSALNGHCFSTIRVLAKESSQELEGICYWDGKIYAVLLDTMYKEKDDIFFKAFTATNPALV